MNACDIIEIASDPCLDAIWHITFTPAIYKARPDASGEHSKLSLKLERLLSPISFSAPRLAAYVWTPHIAERCTPSRSASTPRDDCKGKTLRHYMAFHDSPGFMEADMTIIAMTREIGTRGMDVAQGIADSLNLKVIHDDIVEHDLAGRLGVQEGAIHRFVEGDASILERWKIDKQKLSLYTAEEILELAQAGNVLIRGWGAVALLRDVPNVLCVRVCAPMPVRARVLMDRLGLKDVSAVHREILHNDTAQARLMKGLFGLESSDPLHYNIVLNTGRIPVATCVRSLRLLTDDPAFQQTEATLAALRDKLIEWKVRAALSEHQLTRLETSTITPAAVDGKVSISGACFDVRQKDEAEEVVRGIAGVKDVDNQIVVVRPWAY